MTRYPRLARMRAAVYHRDAPVRELNERLGLARMHALEALDALDKLRRIIGTAIFREVTARVREQIWDAVRKATGVKDDIARIEIPIRDLAWLDSESLVRRVLEEWTLKSAPRLECVTTSKLTREDVYATILDITVPKLGYSEIIHNDQRR